MEDHRRLSWIEDAVGVGSILVRKAPSQPHETAQEALKSAVIGYWNRHNNLNNSGLLLGTGSVRVSCPAESHESDGGFRGEGSPANLNTTPPVKGAVI